MSRSTKKGPYIGIDGGLASRASAFEAFTRKATAIDASFVVPSGWAAVANGYQTFG